MHRNDYIVLKALLGATVALGVNLFREIQSGKVKITIENGFFAFDRASSNFPLNFKIRIPNEQEVRSALQDWLSFEPDHLPSDSEDHGQQTR